MSQTKQNSHQFIKNLKKNLLVVIHDATRQDEFVRLFHKSLVQEIQGLNDYDRHKVVSKILYNIDKLMIDYPVRMRSLRQKMLPSSQVKLQQYKSSAPKLIKHISLPLRKPYSKETLHNVVNYANKLEKSNATIQQTQVITPSSIQQKQQKQSQQKQQSQKFQAMYHTQKVQDQQIIQYLKQGVPPKMDFIKTIFKDSLIPLRPKIIKEICEKYPEAVKSSLLDQQKDDILFTTIFQKTFEPYQQQKRDDTLLPTDLVQNISSITTIISKIIKCIEPLTQEEVNKIFELKKRRAYIKRIMKRTHGGDLISYGELNTYFLLRRIYSYASYHYWRRQYTDIHKEQPMSIEMQNFWKGQKVYSSYGIPNMAPLSAQQRATLTVADPTIILECKEFIVKIFVSLLQHLDTDICNSIFSIEKNFNSRYNLHGMNGMFKIYQEILDETAGSL